MFAEPANLSPGVSGSSRIKASAAPELFELHRLAAAGMFSECKIRSGNFQARATDTRGQVGGGGGGGGG